MNWYVIDMAHSSHLSTGLSEDDAIMLANEFVEDNGTSMSIAVVQLNEHGVIIHHSGKFTPHSSI